MSSVAESVAAAAAGLAGKETAPAQATDDTPVAGEQTAEALHGRAPDAGEHDQGHGQGHDELGRFTPKPKAKEKVKLINPSKPAEAPDKAKETGTPSAPEKPDAAKAPEPPAAIEKPADPPKPKEPALVAPRNMKVTAREKWAEAPREIQEEFIRLNRDAQTALTKSDKERQYAAGIRQALQPYEHMLRAENLDAPRAISDLMQTAAMLRTGTPAQKEAWVADTINRFGINVDGINNALNGTQPAATPPQAAPAQYRPDPRIDQLIAQQQQFIAQQQAAVEAEAARQKEAVDAFGATAEFFEDVVGRDRDGKPIRIRDEMADEIEKAARRGKPLTFEQAHARVLASHKEDPDSEIGKVLRQRAEAVAAKEKLAQSQQAKAAAAVSVKAEPAPVVVQTGKKTVSDYVHAAAARLAQQ